MHRKLRAPTDPLVEIKRLRDAGRFRDAFGSLETLDANLAIRHHTKVIRAELLERIGRASEAQTIIGPLLKSHSLSGSDRALCEFTLARICIDTGNSKRAVEHLNRTINIANRSGDLDRLCHAQLKLLLLISDGISPDAAAPLVAEVRTSAARTGNPRSLAAVHIYLAQIDGFRGSIDSAKQHLRLAQNLLADVEDLWLDSVIENILLALAIMSSEFTAAEAHAKRGHELALRTGALVEYVVNQGNSGFLFHLLGRFDDAIRCYEEILGRLSAGSEAYRGTIDSLARVMLSQGRLQECDALLTSAEVSASNLEASYVSRHTLLTRAQLCLHTQDFQRAHSVIDEILKAATKSCDRLLFVTALMARTDIFLATSRSDNAHQLIDEIATRIPGHPAALVGRYNLALAKIYAATNNPAAKHNFDRAERIFASLRNEREFNELQYPMNNLRIRVSSTPPSPATTVSSTIQSCATLFSQTRHPEIVGREALAILSSTNTILYGVVRRRFNDGQVEPFIQIGDLKNIASDEQRIVLEQTSESCLELGFVPSTSPEAPATLHAFKEMLAMAMELQSVRNEQNKRTALWNMEPASPDGGPILSGHMLELMQLTRRVAKTTVNVLITGESGTGKEILARAIHDYSDRSQKAFVPLNCAAVPRDLLESQLFGHRRGAFTGADRDQLGVIRSADGGTIFLDEVGEMSSDLQPKLLRFLESGEIAPLGEPSPMNVNVRVVAATNSNLDEAVRAGRFREDLFYRLNVVRLVVRPLRERRDEIPGLAIYFVARAAAEYGKGHLDISEDAMERLLLYRWPGNIRQLQNEIHRIVALAEPGSTVQADAISPDILGALPDLRRPLSNGKEITVPVHEKLAPTLARIEYEMIKTALRHHHGRMEPAAKALGISRKGLYLKRQRLGL